jgi:hypothetical protein
MIGFFDLPAELRNNIYHMVLIHGSSKRVEVHSSGIEEPAILLISKQIRNEAVGIYYGQKEFHFTIHLHNSDLLLKWH